MRLALADLLMALLCAVTSFWLIYGAIVPTDFSFDADQCFAAASVLTIVLTLIGVKLNHMAARRARITLGRGRRR
jgi:hypothetical protein